MLHSLSGLKKQSTRLSNLVDCNSALSECCDAGKRLAFDKLHGSTATGGDEGHLVSELELVDSCNAVTAADDGISFFVGTNGQSNLLCALCESVHLEYAHRAIPEDGLGFGDGLGVELARLGSDVQAHHV